MPFSALFLCSLESEASYLGPPGAAAVMWAATPIFTDFSGSEFGPLVVRSHFEQRNATRSANTFLVRGVKSSLGRVTVTPGSACLCKEDYPGMRAAAVRTTSCSLHLVLLLVAMMR